MSIEVRNNAKAERYELTMDGELAGFVEYIIERNGALNLIHTEVDKRFQNQGLAGKLVGAVLDDARSAARAVQPSCPYVRKYIVRHPEYVDLVRPEEREFYGLA